MTTTMIDKKCCEKCGRKSDVVDMTKCPFCLQASSMIDKIMQAPRQTMDTITKTEYQAIHYWLNKKYGLASYCESPVCLKISTKFNWAKKKEHGYERKRKNFWQLCRSCHAIYDCTEETRRKISRLFKGKKLSHDLVMRQHAPCIGVPRPESVRAKIALNNPCKKPVVQISEGDVIRGFSSIHEAARAMDVCHQAIAGAIKNSRRCKGFQWKYAN